MPGEGGMGLEDERIIALLFARSEEGLCALKEKYGSLCRAIAHGILGDARDAEECVADAYWGVWRAIPPARPSPLGAYVAKVARNLALKRRRDVSAKKRSVRFECALCELQGALPAPGNVEQEVEARELAALLTAFVRSLTPENRAVFLGRYWFFESCREIGGRVGLNEKAVSVRLSRLRRKLRDYLTEQGVLE